VPRTVPDSLGILLRKQVTAVGYFIKITDGTTSLFMCDIGTIEVGGIVFVANDVRISGVGTDAVSVVLQNVDNVIGGLVLSADRLPDLEIDIAQFERGDPAAAVLIGQFVPTRASVGLDVCRFELRRSKAATRFAPTRRVNERGGLRFAPQASEFVFSGTRIVIKEN
jgi:hypothetical protein